MALLGQELKNLRTELKEHRINAVEGNQRPVDPNQKGTQNATRFCGYCRTNGHTPNYCRKKMRMTKSRSCRMKPEQRKRLRSPKITTRDEDPTMDLGIGPVGTMVRGLRCQPHDHLLEETSGQVLRILTTSDKIDPPSEETTRITIIIDTMATGWDHHTSQTMTNPGIGEVIITIRDRLHCHDKNHTSRISAINPDQIRLILQYSTDLGIETRVTINLATRNSQLPTMEIRQTRFDSLQEMMKLMDYRDYAL